MILNGIAVRFNVLMPDDQVLHDKEANVVWVHDQDAAIRMLDVLNSITQQMNDERDANILHGLGVLWP